MAQRFTIWMFTVLTVASAAFAAGCARMCAMGGSAVKMRCWFANLTGWTCDTGMLIALITATLVFGTAALFVWLADVARRGQH